MPTPRVTKNNPNPTPTLVSPPPPHPPMAVQARGDALPGTQPAMAGAAWDRPNPNHGEPTGPIVQENNLDEFLRMSGRPPESLPPTAELAPGPAAPTPEPAPASPTPTDTKEHLNDLIVSRPADIDGPGPDEAAGVQLGEDTTTPTITKEVRDRAYQLAELMRRTDAERSLRFVAACTAFFPTHQWDRTYVEAVSRKVKQLLTDEDYIARQLVGVMSYQNAGRWETSRACRSLQWLAVFEVLLGHVE